MAIQLRRGDYEDFDPQKMKPAEVGVVQMNDPNTSDGKAVYVAINPGDVKRLVSDIEIQDVIYNETEEIINQIEQGVADTVAQAEAWVTGEVDGEPVPTTDPAYHNNAKYYAEQAAESARTLVIDDTLTHAGQAADAKAVGDKLTPLIGGDEHVELTGWVYGKWINTGSAVEIGDTVDITSFTDWYSLKHVIVECQAGDKFLIDITGATNARAYAFLTSNNVLLSRSDAGQAISDYITAPQNAGKVVIQGVYRQSDTDTTTDNGTAYKIVQGSGNVVRFDIVQDKTDAQKAIARENIGITSSGEGLSEDAKAALLACFRNVAWINDDGQTYYAALYNALYGGDTPSENINVTFNANGRTFYTDDPIESLKNYLTVTYNGTATANYDLVGAFSQNNIKVKIGNEYSGVIPVQAEVIKRSLSTADGDITFLNAGVKMTGERIPALDTQTTTKRAVGMTQGRIKYGNSNTWYSVPMPADCTEITVNVEPSTFKYYITAWKFVPQSDTCTYFSESTLVSGTHKHTVPQNDGLLVVSIMIQNSNNTTITTEPTKCEIEFS